MIVPSDDFTPHGYLDNPYHSWKLNPSGVLRSRGPLGMGWHVPNLGSYARNQFQYTAHLTLGLTIGKTVLVTPEDFKRHGCTIVSHLHTKNRFEYTCVVSKYALTLTARYFLVQEHVLGCILTLSTTVKQPLPVTCFLIHQHTHNPHTSRAWEHGLYAINGPQEGTAMLGIASEGDVFVHGARSADGFPLTFEDMGYVVSLDDALAWAQGREVAPPSITQSQPDTGWQVRTVILPCCVTMGGESGSVERIINVVLARGVSRNQSYQHWEDGMEEIARAEVELRTDDEYFWSRAPQLAGDWPESWRRGLVYDFETLRMVMRPSVGLIPHIFDGMQIQAPRLVLAEAAMDTLFFSYANPELAAEVILGHFESAPHPNLPCMREDGSYNMVADDGQVCGTAPEWGFPLWCCDQIVRRTGDLLWLRRLYPKAAAYLRWWLEHRRDAEGWLVYACSWESGQDVSSRFGPQQTGGTIIEHVRPVDLQASMAQGAEILARWANLLGQEQLAMTAIETPIDFAAEAAWWQQIANEFSVKTGLMWQHGWFRDYDAVTSEWSSQQDAMHLAPVFCGVADWGQVEQLRPFLAQPPMHSSGWAPLSWPPVVMTLVGAADVAQMPLEAAELAYRFIDASYRSTDRRELDEQSGLPGVTREYHATVARGKWGAFDYANAGIEGYGWGALNIHLLIRHLLGLYATDPNSITLAPTLPLALRRPGATYTIAPIPWGKYILTLTCRVKNAHSYEATFHSRPRAQEGQPVEKTQARSETVGEQEHHWEGTWGEERTFLLDR
ncbi:MAG TPA: trehalase family glycosidase [Ktedonobacteraceae bacterium]